MLVRSFFTGSLALLIAAGCGGSASTGPSTGGSAGAGGGTGGTGGNTGGSTSTTTDTAGGAGGSTSTGGTGGTTSTGGGGSSASCYVDLAVDNGAPQKLPSTCSGFTSALTDEAEGYIFYGNLPDSPHGIRIVGCESADPSAFGVFFDALDLNSPGTTMSGNTTFIDQNGQGWGMPGEPFQANITTVEATGGVIEGTFTATVTNGGNAGHSLSGSFHVCHVEDFLPP